VVIVDLPALIDEIAEAVIAEADKVVLVCTPETPSLSMVRRRLWELESRGVRLRHLQVLVNRHAPGDPEPGEMVAITQHEVAAVLPEDAFAVKSASRRNGLVNSDSRLLRSMVCFAGDLLGLEPPASRASPFALFKKFMSRALGRSSQGAFESSAHTRLEASSACYHSGGRRQLDRW
jgi:septum formation inhibitor-activating ATPase MinD